jgi:arginase
VMSLLRAKCPDCSAYTAVALGPEYECHACGRVFQAGLVRVPRAWGKGGEAMAEAAGLPLPYPEAVVVAEDSLGEQTLALASELPERPLVLGGCCCAHVGAVKGLAARYERLALVWFDAHGDLNTPSSSPSGNEWGMPLRMLLDSDAVRVEDAALIGARNLDSSEREFLADSGLGTGAEAIDRALEGADGVYVAFDCDVLEPGELRIFMPEPGGLSLAEAEATLVGIAERSTVIGAGLSGLAPDPGSVGPLTRLLSSLGL